MAENKSNFGNTQTFLIECSRGNSLIDTKDGGDFNAKWTNETNFNLRRGDVVSVEMMALNAQNAVSGSALEFTGDAVVVDGTQKKYCDNKVLLEVFFYMNNNNTYSVGLPLIHPEGGINAVADNKYMPIQGETGSPSAPQFGKTCSNGTIGYFQTSVVAGAISAGQIIPAKSYVILGWNTANSPDDPPNYIANIPAAGTSCCGVVLADFGDPNPNAGVFANYDNWITGNIVAANATPVNFLVGNQLGYKDDTGAINFGDGGIKITSMRKIGAGAPAPFASKIECNFPFTIVNDLGNPISQGNLIACEPSTRDGSSEFGLPNYDNLKQTGQTPNNTQGRRDGNQLYNYSQNLGGSNPAGTSVPYNTFPNTTYGGGATRNATTAYDRDNNKQGFRNGNLRMECNGKPYIFMRNDYHGIGRQKPNCSGFYPKAEPQTAFILLEADELFTDTTSLANKLNDILHQALSPFNGDVPVQDNYITNDTQYSIDQFKSSSVIPARNTYGFYDQGVYNNATYSWKDTYSALWTKILPIKYGGCTKVQPANFRPGFDLVGTATGQFFLPIAGTSEEQSNILKNTYIDFMFNREQNNSYWNGEGRTNTLMGNCAVADMFKEILGDRMMRLPCLPFNTIVGGGGGDGIRDIGRPVIVNTKFNIEPTNVNVGGSNCPIQLSKCVKSQLIFTNIEYPMIDTAIINPNDPNNIVNGKEFADFAKAVRDYELYGNKSTNAATTYKTQKLDKTGWCIDLDMGVTDDNASVIPNIYTTPKTTNVTPIVPAWCLKFPNNADPAAAGGLYGTGLGANFNGGGDPTQPLYRRTISPAFSSPAFGSDLTKFDWLENWSAYRGLGKIWLESRFDPDWRTTSKSVEDSIPAAGADANCKILTDTDELLPFNPTNKPAIDFVEALDIGCYPYIYTDDDGNKQLCCAFRTMYDVDFDNNITSSMEMGMITWGLPIGVSQSSMDNHKIVPVNGDQAQAQNPIKNVGTGSTIDIARQLSPNQVNYIHIGANNPTFQFNSEKNRFEFVNLQTDNLLSQRNQASANPPAYLPQAGNKVGIINGAQKDAIFNVPNPITRATSADNYSDPIKNQGLRAEIGGVGVYKIWLCPPDYTFPEDVNPVNYWDKSTLTKTTENRDKIIEGCTEATDDEWEGCLLNRLGFDVEDFIPRYGRQFNRFDPSTYNNPNPNIIGNGIKPLMLNNAFDAVINPSLNIYWIPNPPSGDVVGIPQFNHGFNQENPVLLSTQSLPLTAATSPVLTTSPFFVVYSDIVADRKYQSGSTPLPAVFYCMKNYANSGFLYGYGSTFSIMVNQDRMLSQINTEIRNPQDGRLAKLSPNSVIVYKIQRQATIPAPMVDVFGNPENQQQPDPNLLELEKIFAAETAIGAKISGGSASRTGGSSENIRSGGFDPNAMHNIINFNVNAVNNPNRTPAEQAEIDGTRLNVDAVDGVVGIDPETGLNITYAGQAAAQEDFEEAVEEKTGVPFNEAGTTGIQTISPDLLVGIVGVLIRLALERTRFGASGNPRRLTPPAAQRLPNTISEVIANLAVNFPAQEIIEMWNSSGGDLDTTIDNVLSLVGGYINFGVRGNTLFREGEMVNAPNSAIISNNQGLINDLANIYLSVSLGDNWDTNPEGLTADREGLESRASEEYDQKYKAIVTGMVRTAIRNGEIVGEILSPIAGEEGKRSIQRQYVNLENGVVEDGGVFMRTQQQFSSQNQRDILEEAVRAGEEGLIQYLSQTPMQFESGEDRKPPAKSAEGVVEGKTGEARPQPARRELDANRDSQPQTMSSSAPAQSQSQSTTDAPEQSGTTPQGQPKEQGDKK